MFKLNLIKALAFFLLACFPLNAVSAETQAPAGNPDAKALMDRAAQYRSVGRIDEAIAAYEEANRIEPDNPMIYRNLGVLHFENEDLPRAESALKESLGLANNDPYTFLYLGRVMTRKADQSAESRADLEMARFYLEKALQVNSRLEEAHVYYGLVLSKLGRFEEGRREFEIAKSLEPRDPRPFIGLGNLYYRSQNYAAAIQEFETALTMDPDNTEAHNGLGVTYYELGDLPRAQMAFEEALATNPQDSTAMNNLGVLLQSQGRYDEAERVFRRAVEVDPGNKMAVSNLQQLDMERSSGGYDPMDPMGRRMQPRGMSFPVYSSGGAQGGQAQGGIAQIGTALLTQYLVSKLAKKKEAES